MPITKLSDILISRIAAGEVIERPASVVKELIENSIDAAANQISLKIEHGGRNLIEIRDNGHGIAKSDLELAVTRHATSKISNSNLIEINSLGFRGEGLASIASISKLSLSSKTKNQDFAYEINVTGGKKNNITASNISNGTLVTIHDLFFATPARLKFLKSEKSENNHIIEIIRKIALAHHHISFSLDLDHKNYFNFTATNQKDRIVQIIGDDFIKNSEEISSNIDNYKFTGFTSLPTYNRASAQHQYIYVNKRPIKDKIIHNAIKTAYQDYLAKDRHAVIILFIEIEPQEIDVNVHPTKAEIRFRDPQKLRSNLILALKNTIKKSGFKASSETSEKAINYLNDNKITRENHVSFANISKANSSRKPAQISAIESLNIQHSKDQDFTENFAHFAPSSKDQISEIDYNYTNYPLGSAIAQLHKTFIIAQTNDGLIIVDQHAAHERIIYEKLKKSLNNKNIATQKHLFSEIVELTEEPLNLLLENQEKLAQYGVIIEKFGAKALIIKETPEVLKELNIKTFIQDLADIMIEYGDSVNLLDKFTEIYGNYACHHSIRAGRELNINEMNDILRKMEETPFSGQCNHGRPTYVELKKENLEKLFGRK